MPKRSAGILLYKLTDDSGLEIWLAHMGGPFWARKDAGAWSIPKGEFDEGEDPIEVALREFDEEMGVPAHRRRLRKTGRIQAIRQGGHGLRG